MKSIFIIFIVLIGVYTANAQQLSGTVMNAESAYVAGATVSLLNTNRTTVSDERGKFEFKNLSPGKYILTISNVGFNLYTKEISFSNKPQHVTIRLNKLDKQLDEIVITAQKSPELLQKAPLSVTTLSAQQVQDYRIWNLMDLAAIVPNLYSSNPGDNRNVTSLRGIATTSYDPAVATYIDGVNQFSLDTYIPQLFDVERIEVLRGPQGTLYGRNAMGGVINVITKQPTNKTTGFIEATLGNYNQQRYSLGISAPLIKNKLFFGIAGLYNGLGGFYTNDYNNTKFDKQHSFSGNYYLKYLATKDLSITLNVKNYVNRNNGPFALSGSPADALSTPFRINQNATTKMIDNILNASLAIKKTWKDLDLLSISTYQKNYRYYNDPIDGDFSPLDAVSLVNNYGNKFNKVEVATQEFKLASLPSASNIKWVAGIYGFYRYSPSKIGTHFGADAGAVGSPLTDFTSINYNIERNYGAAVYGQVTYAFSPEWETTIGIRYDYEHKKQAIKGEFQPDGEDATITQPDTSSKAHFKAFSPKLSIAYHLSASNNFYASYSRGFRAGGISQLSSDPSQAPLFAYQPEYSNNYELGSKNLLLDKKLRVNLSLFLTTVNNAQVPTLILPDAITVTKNAGKLNSKGIEAEIESQIFKGFDLGYTFGYTHARYRSLLISSNGNTVDLKGNSQVYTPAITSMAMAQYAFNLNPSNNTKLIARAEWRYLGSQYFDVANTIKQDAYNLFNAKLGLTTKPIDVYVWGSNLFNKRYINYAYDFGASHLGNPRTVGITFRKNF